MRHARIKPEHQDTWHHCYNRAVGNREDHPFGDIEKEVFVRILQRLSHFYTVHIVSYAFMSNHFHIILQAPANTPSAVETAARYAAFHKGRRHIFPSTPVCTEWAARLRDVSWFMRHFQHLCTAWYNRTRPIRRRGPLWAGRFKNTILESGQAVWACWAYVERNPVRAGLVIDPADYRFCTYGQWARTGQHPFPDAVTHFLAPALPPPFESLDATGALQALKARFAREAAEDRAQQEGTQSLPTAEFLLTARRRVRHRVDGVVIGSELFVREVVRHAWPTPGKPMHRLAKATREPNMTCALYCWRRLRVAIE